MLDIKEISAEFEKQSRMDRCIVVTLKSEQRIVLSSTVSALLHLLVLYMYTVDSSLILSGRIILHFYSNYSYVLQRSVRRTRCSSHNGRRSSLRHSARVRRCSAASTRRWCECTARASSRSRRPFPPRPAAPPPPPRRASLPRSSRPPRRRRARRVPPPTIVRAVWTSRTRVRSRSTAASRLPPTPLPRCSHTTHRIRNLLL